MDGLLIAPRFEEGVAVGSGVTSFEPMSNDQVQIVWGCAF